MLEVYWGMLVTGVLFALVTVLFGDLLSNTLDGMLDWMSGDVMHWLQPMLLFSGLTVWGGAGVLLTRYTAVPAAVVFLLGLLAAIGAGVLIYFLYVKPMQNTENSVAFSLQELVGRIGEVSVSIPAAGCGEVIVRTGGGVTNQIAESFDGTAIPGSGRVVIVDVREGILRVSPLEMDL